METVLFIAGIALLMLIVGLVGNKVVDAISNPIRNRSVKKYNEQHPAENESLADRFEKGRKL